MVDLGPLALENTIGKVPDIIDLVTTEAANIEPYFDPSTLPEMLDKSPDQPLYVALMQTLSCGATPLGPTVADLIPGDLRFARTFFRDRFGEVLSSGSWRFFVTPTKAMGVAPAAARYDDTLCILMGAEVPFVLRKISVENSRAGGNDYELIGSAFLHGYMSGEAIVDIFRGRRKAVLTFIHIH
jgi:hypothetical protein